MLAVILYTRYRDNDGHRISSGTSPLPPGGTTTNLRRYGTKPFSVAVIHGGPGAPGEVAPVARDLSVSCGVLEPLQTATSLDGQIDELRSVLQEAADLPVTLIGHSWGAWLSYLEAAYNPFLVSKVILVSSGPFEAHYTSNLMDTRLGRLGSEERAEAQRLMAALSNGSASDSELGRFGEIMHRADSYDPVPVESEPMECDSAAYQGVWSSAAELRRSGKLLSLGQMIRCPVLAVHGDYDPHPYEGVRDPLSRTLGDFRFVLLEKCGHTPWAERHARERFFTLLREEIAR